MEFSMDKLKEAILLVLNVMGSSASKVKLAKALFYADFKAYERNRCPITGDKYVHYAYGPVPSHFSEALRELEKEGNLVIIPGSWNAWKFEPCREPQTEIFTQEEQELFERGAHNIAQMSAKAASDWSHLFRGWQMTKKSEYIHYEIIDVLADDDEEEEMGTNEMELLKSPEFQEFAQLAIADATENPA